MCSNCKLFLVLLMLFFIKEQVKCANILLVASLRSPSHHLWNEIYTLGLVEKGHNVTVLSHDEPKVKHPNYTVIQLEGAYEEDLNLPNHLNVGGMRTADFLLEVLYDFCLFDSQTKGLQTLLDYPDDFFDLIVWDLVAGQCMYPLITKFRYPTLIATCPFALPPYLSQTFGNQIPYYTYYFTDKTYDQMNFFERIRHHFYVNYLVWTYKLWYLPKSQTTAEERFKDYEVLTIDEYERKISLLLSNTNPIWDDVVPFTPNIIPVGGLHIRKPKKLPDDLQKFLEDAKDGFIYFSFGTNIKPELFEKVKLMLRVLEKLPNKVLWKVDDTALDDIKVPSNVFTKKWFPQNDILGHKNLKLFISHGGALSTQEALYHGAPLVIVHFVVDQTSNAVRLAQRQVAIEISYLKLKEDNFQAAVNEVLNNPRYKKEARRLSSLFKDQLNTPLEKAVYWTEYAIRHKNLTHLDPISRDMVFYETIHLDIILFIEFVAVTIISLISYTCCCKRQNVKLKTH